MRQDARFAGAALEVFETEPDRIPVLTREQIIVTPLSGKHGRGTVNSAVSVASSA